MYIGVLTLALVGFPLLRSIILELSTPSVLNALAAPRADLVTATVGGLLLSAAAALGRLHSPLFLNPVQVLLTSNDLPRRRTLLPWFAATTTVVTATAAVVAASVGGVQFGTDISGLPRVVGFVVACSCFGVLTCTVWLFNHLTRGGYRLLMPGALLATTALTTIVPNMSWLTPWGWLGQTWAPGTGTTGPAVSALFLAAAAAAWFAWHGLDLLDGSELLQEAQVWHFAWNSAASGEATVAAAGLRARPSVGRTWNAVAGGSTALRYLRSDVVALARTPGRFAVGSTALVLACALFVATPLVGSLVAAVGSALAYLALGVFGDGFRLAAQTGSGPQVFGIGTGRLFALHAFLPVLALIVALLVAVLVSALCGYAPAVIRVLGCLITGLGLVLLRAFDSAKGPMPPRLLTPIPSAQAGSDLSGVRVLAWQLDALLIAVAVGLCGTVLAPWTALALITATAAGLLIGLHRRLRTN